MRALLIVLVAVTITGVWAAPSQAEGKRQYFSVTCKEEKCDLKFWETWGGSTHLLASFEVYTAANVDKRVQSHEDRIKTLEAGLGSETQKRTTEISRIEGLIPTQLGQELVKVITPRLTDVVLEVLPRLIQEDPAFRKKLAEILVAK
ncbi:MAG: hypothetical protein BVN28_06655 [Nitrospira sp. ST-bin4]|nr:MAG: hypothetical protein BVN28_06655 [Nitrospira sp. ST-bin4]